ncbi:FkbM family methyltransferase [Castellaniella sp.]|uniref:FkbM family methyltransferase n=1 Tax=Castellaniella sp. TaxID=1955812 RepID=UPI003A959CBF
MTLISFAQNREDVLLMRALKHVDCGFYVDVGANHPSDDSVTKAFYDLGWHGLNIEPLVEHITQLRTERPRDINLRVAAGACEGEITLYAPPIRGLATASAEVANRHADRGLIMVASTVPMRPLAEICAEYISTNDIHFLKIDVEGFEGEVLKGMDFQRFRPWIVLIEATLPNSQRESIEWEPMIVGAGYHKVYFDGLNCYYVADEHADLANAFRAPPNVFDNYISAEQHRLSEKLIATEIAIERERAEFHDMQADMEHERVEAREAFEREIADANHAYAALRTELSGVYNSRSWRCTRPLRAAVNVMRNLSGTAVSARTKLRATSVEFLSRIANSALTVLERHQGIKQVVLIAFKALGMYRVLKLLKWKVLAQRELALYTATGGVRLNPRVFPTIPTRPEAMFLPKSTSAIPRWVRLTGHVEGHYSLAIVNRGIAGALERVTQQRLSFVPYHGKPYTKPPSLSPEQEAHLGAALCRVVPADVSEDAISVVHHYPFITDEQPAGQHGIIFFWEETSVPSDIIANINSNFDVVWVAATSVKRALVNSGCLPPVFVLPIGVDHLIDGDVAPLRALHVEKDQRLRFLHVSSVFERKGADVLIAAYLDAFTADDPVELYIKTFPNPHNTIKQQLAMLSAEHSKPARVVIDEDPLDDQGLLTLYRSAHVMVLPTRGEGFNLPAAEALAVGLPVVTTGSGAQVDFCTASTAILVNFSFSASRSHLRASDACWLEPDRSDLTAKLQMVRHRILSEDPSLLAQREAGLRYVRETYTWENTASGLLNSANWLAGRHKDGTAALRLALVSPWFTRCGIAEYSDKLLCAIIGAADVRLDIYCDERTEAPPVNAVPSWRLGDNSSVPDVLTRIGRSEVDIVLVEHQPSLFPLSDRCCFQLAELSRQGVTVMLELHATLPLLMERRLSASAVNSLACLDRIIVHKPGDLNNLLALGLADNVVLLPHGVIQPPSESHSEDIRNELEIPSDALVLGGFGFALAHKGIDTLVKTIRPLARASGRPVYFLALNSELDERSKGLIQACKEDADRLGVSGQIRWITDYRPIEECQKILCAADYIVFPYKDTRESASGAVTIGLSTLRPVLVSPQEIFSDLQNITWKMDGHDVVDIVNAVVALEAKPDIADSLIERQLNWLLERDWRVLSERFLVMMKSLCRERKLNDVIAPARRKWETDWKETQRKKLLIDVSELYYRDSGTGIQRVVRNILNEIFQKPPAGYDICPVYGEKGGSFRHTGKFHRMGIDPRDELTVDVGPGDVFLGLDLAAHLFPEAESQLEKFRLAGARIYYVIYDIIPLQYPQFTVAGISQAFDVWLRALSRSADGLVCISEAVASDVADWLREQNPSQVLPAIGYFHLGSEIDRLSPAHDLTVDEDETIAKIDAHLSFLMVGTIEPRKGHAQMLEAFEKLWLEGNESRLVLVGKQGWNMDAFSQRLRSHPEIGRRLLWLEKVSDGYLNEIYGHADCLIAASECEGFGLPLVEAAQHNLPIIARDIPVFREVGGTHAFYFDGSTGGEISKSLKIWLTLHESDRHPKSSNMTIVTWQESASQLLAILDLK